MSPPKGVLYVDKPEGPTSHDAVRLARKALGERRIGHTGTLDPFATGLLILLIGPATRLAETFSALEKRYAATVLLGEETDTADGTGVVVRREEGADRLTQIAVEEALTRQLGTIQQRPPRYSAKKIDGQAAHRRVRRGEEVEMAPAEVTIHALRVTRFEPPELDLDVRCSTGTYVRSIAHDLGADLGVGGHLTALRRTAIGPYSVDDALSWDELADAEQARLAVRPAAEELQHLDRFELTVDEVTLIQSGRAVPAPSLATPALATHQGQVLSVGETRDGAFYPKKVFPDGA